MTENRKVFRVLLSGEEAQLEIRPMTEADLPSVVILEKNCFPDPWNERMLKGTLEARAETALAAELIASGNRRVIAGYMSLMHAADEGELLRIAVDPAFRRMGIADKMMETMKDWADAQKIVSIFLEVRSQNAAAIALYDKHGFEKIGLRKNYYHDPEDHACIMRKE